MAMNRHESVKDDGVDGETSKSSLESGTCFCSIYNYYNDHVAMKYMAT